MNLKCQIFIQHFFKIVLYWCLDLIRHNIGTKLKLNKYIFDSIMEALIIQTGTPPGLDGIALWVTMKNSNICHLFFKTGSDLPKQYE
jgi:hypothetical protein